jgi:hypothetical protein
MINLYRRVKIYLSQARPPLEFTLSTQKYVARSSASFGSSFGNILKFAVELKNMVCHILWPKAETNQSDPRKEAAGARARNAVEGINGGHRRAAVGGGRLSRRRYSCPEGRPWGWCKTCVSQVATGVVLGEPGFA